jgi:hypothetical protein
MFSPVFAGKYKFSKKLEQLQFAFWRCAQRRSPGFWTGASSLTLLLKYSRRPITQMYLALPIFGLFCGRYDFGGLTSVLAVPTGNREEGFNPLLQNNRQREKTNTEILELRSRMTGFTPPKRSLNGAPGDWG